jgi:flagellin-like hook-associated protein FlgL
MKLTNITNSILTNSAQIQEITDKIASGTNILKGSEAPSDYNQILNLNDKIEKLTRIDKDINYAVNYQTVSENSIYSIQDDLEQVFNDLQLLGNLTFSENDKEIILDRMYNIKESLLQTANSKHDDQFVFSGTLSYKEAFSDDFTYNGNDIRKSAYVSSNGIDKEYSITGQELFIDSELFSTLDNIISLIENPTAVVSSELKELNSSYSNKNLEVIENNFNNEIIASDPNYPIIEQAFENYKIALDNFISDPSEANQEILEMRNNILTKDPFSLIGNMAIPNDNTSMTAFTSNVNGAYAFTIPAGMENIEINLNDRGANDTFQLFDVAGNHLAGSSILENGAPASNILLDNPTLFNTNVSYSDSELNSSDGISYLGPNNDTNTFEMPVGSGNLIGDEKITITGSTTEDRVLFIEGSGSFDISASWEMNLGNLLSEDTKELIQRNTDMALFQNDLDNWQNETVNFDLKEEYHQIVLDNYDKLLYKDVLDPVSGEVIGSEPYDDIVSKGSEDMYDLASNPYSYKINDVEEVRENVQYLQSRLGNEMNYLLDTKGLNESNKISLTLFLSETKDLDIAVAATELQKRTTSLEALYQILSNIQKLSLTNYL